MQQPSSLHRHYKRKEKRSSYEISRIVFNHLLKVDLRSSWIGQKQKPVAFLMLVAPFCYFQLQISFVQFDNLKKFMLKKQKGVLLEMCIMFFQIFNVIVSIIYIYIFWKCRLGSWVMYISWLFTFFELPNILDPLAN